MTIMVKICGLSTQKTLTAALEAGAAAVGFIFFEKSPRHLDIKQAAALAKMVPPTVTRTGVFVDPDDDRLARTLAAVPLDLIQLHGQESPHRVEEIKTRFGVAVMKAIAVSGAKDIIRAQAYTGVSDRLLFDAKAPAGANLPGGNGLAFDWALIQGIDWPLPWMLSGGLDAHNVAAAIRISGCSSVDVSSGVEDVPGIKNTAKIKAFIKAADRTEDDRK